MNDRSIAKGRLLAAIIAAPILGSLFTLLAFTLYILVSFPATEGMTLAELAPFIRIGLICGAGIGWPAMLLFGLPMHRWICWRGVRHWFTYLALGAVAGTAASLIFFGALSGGDFVLASGLSLILGAPTGVASAFAFYLIRGPVTT